MSLLYLYGLLLMNLLSLMSRRPPIDGLLEDRLDMALLYQATQDVRLRRHHLWTSSPIQTVVHKDHPLTAIHRPLTLADLLPHKGASLQEHFGLREFISQADQDERVQLNFEIGRA